MPNPYHYGTPAVGDQFTGRAQELKALLSRIRDGIGLALMSPRRYGKTSLLIRAEDTLVETGALVVRVNAFGCTSPDVFAARLAAAAYESDAGVWHRTRNAVPEFLRRFRVVPRVGMTENGRLEFSFDVRLSKRDLHTVVTDVYELLGEEHSASRPAVLIIDEFQELPALDEQLPGLFKTLMDSNQNVALVIAGSKRHLIERLVLAKTAPLYGMLEPLSIGPIPEAEMADFLIRRATQGGKEMPEAVARVLIELAGPAPNDIQRLAYETFNVAPRKKITSDDLETALQLVADHGSNDFEMRFGARAAGQQRVLVELAARPTKAVFAGAFRDAVRLSSTGAVQRAIDALAEQDLIAQGAGGAWTVTDPFFAIWLRRLSAS